MYKCLPPARGENEDLGEARVGRRGRNSGTGCRTSVTKQKMCDGNEGRFRNAMFK